MAAGGCRQWKAMILAEQVIGGDWQWRWKPKAMATEVDKIFNSTAAAVHVKCYVL